MPDISTFPKARGPFDPSQENNYLVSLDQTSNNEKGSTNHPKSTKPHKKHKGKLNKSSHPRRHEEHKVAD